MEIKLDEEQVEQIIEALGSAHYNVSKIQFTGTALIPMIQSQIKNAILKISPDWEPVE